MQTLQLAVMVVVLSGLPSAGDSFVPSASDLYLMNQVASFQLLAKGFEPFVGPSDGYEKSYITLLISIRNHSNKDLQAMTGVLEFFDANGALVDSRGFDDVSVIKSHSTVIRDLKMVVNRYDDQDTKFRNVQVSDVRAVFYPSGMYFTDAVLLGSLWNALYCRQQEHKGNSPLRLCCSPLPITEYG
jgi:hypothetical protein